MSEQEPTYEALQARLAEAEAMNEALRSVQETQQDLHTLFDTLDDLLFVLDREGRILHANLTAEKRLGYSVEELRGVPAIDFRPPAQRDEAVAILKDIMAGTASVCDIPLVAKDGTLIDVETRGTRGKWDGQDVLFGVARDVSERKQAEEALQKAHDELERHVEERTDELAKANEQLASEIEERKRAEEQLRRKAAVLQAVNDVFREALTCKTKEELGKTCLAVAQRLTGSKFGFLGELNPKGLMDTIAISNPGWDACQMAVSDARYRTKDMPLRGIDRSTLREGKSRIVNQKQIATHPDRVGVPEGHPAITNFLGVPLKHRGKTIGMIGLGNKPSGYAAADQEAVENLSVAIVEALRNKRAETALRESDQKLRMIADQSVDGIWLLGSNSGVVFASAAGERLFGYSLGETAGMSFEAFFPESELLMVNQVFERVSSGESYQLLEFIGLRKDGSTFPMEISAAPVKKDGTVVGMQGIVRDITDRRRVEAALRESHQRLQETLEELKATQTQVIQQERLRALGEMASGVGHDLNNTLTPVLGYSEMLLDDPQLSSRAHESVRWIRNGARDAVAVVARLRRFYRPSSADDRYRPLRLEGLLRETVNLTRPKWRDEAQREGRNIDVRLRLDDAPPVLGSDTEIREVLTNLMFNAVDALPNGGSIALRLRSESDGAVIEVADTGIGMPAEVQAKCFEPFFTTKGREGTGLGLSVCHGIVQRHGGQFQIDSSPGQGTTISVSLPAAGDRPSLDGDVVETSLPRCRVLYIDDDPRVRSVMERLLQSLGQDVDLAESGVRGLEMLEAEDYDLVITDLGMPDMDGNAVVRGIKASQPELPVVMLTGWGPPGEFSPPKPGGIPDHILAKPPAIAQLREVLADVLR